MNLPRTREDIAARIPHQGAMCLWESVLACDAHGVHCESNGHRDAMHPLRRDGRLAGVHLVEYAAQLMAIHGALADPQAARPGMLAALREVSLDADFIDDLDAPLHGSARRVIANPNGAMYECVVTCAERELLRARISVMFS